MDLCRSDKTNDQIHFFLLSDQNIISDDNYYCSPNSILNKYEIQ